MLLILRCLEQNITPIFVLAVIILTEEVPGAKEEIDFALEQVKSCFEKTLA